MDTSSVALFVNQVGTVPAAPVHLTITSTNPLGLANLLAAVGLEVRKGETVERAEAFIARTVNTVLTVPATAGSTDGSVVALFFLVEKLDLKVEAVVAQGATIVQGVHHSSWGRRAILNFDKRKVVLTERTASGTPFPTDEEIHDAAISHIEADGAEEEAAEWSEAARLSMSLQRLAASVSLMATVIGTLAACGLGMVSKGWYSHLDWNQAAPVVIALIVSLGLSVAGKGICIADRNRSVDAPRIITAMVLEIAALIFAVANFNPTVGRGSVTLAGLCELPATILFTHYWREIGKCFELAKLQTAANYFLTAWMATMVLFILVMGDVFQFDILDPFAGLIWVGFSVSCVVALTLYALTLLQAVVQLHKQLAAMRMIDNS